MPGSLVINARDHLGEPIDCDSLYITDLQGKPHWCEQRRVGPGRLALSCPKVEPFEIHALWKVDGFGQVVLTADNDGEGYALAGETAIDLAAELAKTKARTVTSLLEEVSASTQVEEEVRLFFHDILDALDKGNPHRALWRGLWVGEDLELTKARRQIAVASPERRRGLKFGCNAFGFESTPAYRQRFTEAFDFATVPFYWNLVEPIEGKPDWDTRDRLCKWLSENGIRAKGHPLAWVNHFGIPKWLERHGYDSLKERMYDHCHEVVTRYKDRIKVWDVINEAHDGPWSNTMCLTRDQQLDLTVTAAQAARDADPEATRIVNVCTPWGEYCAWHESRDLMDPYQYLKLAIERGADFHAVGVQMYYGSGPHHLCRDMTQISATLDRYGSLGKPVHITELGTPSDWQEDVRSWTEASPITAAGCWHKPWDEPTQADWVEQYYTIAASKPYIDAITWWDLSDRSKFWPHGGFLDRNDRPKQSFHRLRAFIQGFREGTLDAPDAELYP